MSLEDNKILVRSFFERANRERGTPVDLCAPGFTAHIAGSPPMDLKAFQQFQARFYASFTDLTTTIEDMVGEGDRIAFRGVVRAFHTTEFMGIPASGKQITVPIIGFARVIGGKIAEWWNSPDQMGMMQQIGALPALGQARQ